MNFTLPEKFIFDGWLFNVAERQKQNIAKSDLMGSKLCNFGYRILFFKSEPVKIDVEKDKSVYLE